MYMLSYIAEFLTLSAQFPLSSRPATFIAPQLDSGAPASLEQQLQQQSDRLPLVLWHGMGDTYNSSSMQRVEELIHEVHPNIFIHSIYLDTDQSKDQQASILGDLNAQISDVCQQLQQVPQLADGFNAIGFSQGGLFLRSAIEICGLKVNNLITYGSPHNGIVDFPPCSEGNWLCERRNELLKKQIYRPNIQKSIVQAQYFRDVYNYQTYIDSSLFLKFVNNEQITDDSSDYSKNFVALNKLVMVMFLQDDMVVPKESCWFHDLDPITNDLIPFENARSYKHDLIGLRTLFSKGKIDFLSIDDRHMIIEDDHLKNIANKYL